MIRFVMALMLAGSVLAAPGDAAQAAAGAAEDTLRAGLTVAGGSGPVLAQAGDTLIVLIEIQDVGPSFNAFDAYVRFDPAVLTFLQADFLRDQEGPLMLDACPQTFHIFTQSPDGMTLEVNHSLLCGGVSVTGPGVVYEMQFRCEDVAALTRLDLLNDPGRITRFFMDGVIVQPMVTSSLWLQVGDPASAIPDLLVDGISLRASPNPFNPMTIFSYELLQAGWADLSVYDVRGRLVRRLVSGKAEAGRHRVPWDGRDDAGRRVESGTYFGQVRGVGAAGSVKVTIIE